MEDVLSGSLLLLLPLLAVLFGVWIGNRSDACAELLVGPTGLDEQSPMQADSSANRPAGPIERWLARAKRVAHAASSDDAATLCVPSIDPPVFRLARVRSRS